MSQFILSLPRGFPHHGPVLCCSALAHGWWGYIFFLCGSHSKRDSFKPAVSRLGGFPYLVGLVFIFVLPHAVVTRVQLPISSIFQALPSRAVFNQLFSPSCCYEVLRTHLPVRAGAAVFSTGMWQPSWVEEPCLGVQPQLPGPWPEGHAEVCLSGREAAPHPPMLLPKQQERWSLPGGWCWAVEAATRSSALSKGWRRHPTKSGPLQESGGSAAAVWWCHTHHSPHLVSLLPLSQPERRHHRWESSNTKECKRMLYWF